MTPEETLAALADVICSALGLQTTADTIAPVMLANAIDAHVRAVVMEWLTGGPLASPPPAGREEYGHASGLNGDGPTCVKPSGHESPCEPRAPYADGAEGPDVWVNHDSAGNPIASRDNWAPSTDPRTIGYHRYVDARKLAKLRAELRAATSRIATLESDVVGQLRVQEESNAGHGRAQDKLRAELETERKRHIDGAAAWDAVRGHLDVDMIADTEEILACIDGLVDDRNLLTTERAAHKATEERRQAAVAMHDRVAGDLLAERAAREKADAIIARLRNMVDEHCGLQPADMSPDDLLTLEERHEFELRKALGEQESAREKAERERDEAEAARRCDTGETWEDECERARAERDSARRERDALREAILYCDWRLATQLASAATGLPAFDALPVDDTRTPEQKARWDEAQREIVEGRYWIPKAAAPDPVAAALDAAPPRKRPLSQEQEAARDRGLREVAAGDLVLSPAAPDTTAAKCGTCGGSGTVHGGDGGAEPPCPACEPASAATRRTEEDGRICNCGHDQSVHGRLSGPGCCYERGTMVCHCNAFRPLPPDADAKEKT
jgi:hypothetical protein